MVLFLWKTFLSKIFFTRFRNIAISINKYCQTYNISRTIEAGCSVEIEDVIGAAPTGDAPTTSE